MTVISLQNCINTQGGYFALCGFFIIIVKLI
nr:MAG TPA: hypothetical protein [Caudoviricetes sp.]